MQTHELVKLTSPTIKPSYSPNLHKFLKTWISRLPDYYAPQVWRTNDVGTLMIGRHYQDDPVETASFSGLMLYRVLGVGAKAFNEKACFMHLTPKAMTELPNFWERYLEIGRCAIDGDHTTHFMQSEGRYQLEGNTRTCTWCGAKHTRHVETKTYTKEIEHFEPIAA